MSKSDFWHLKKCNCIIYRLVALLLVASLLILMPGCSGKKDTGSKLIPGSSILPPPKRPVTEAPTNSSNEIVIKGVFTNIDADNKKMNFMDITTKAEYEVPYHGGTDIRNKYKGIIAAVNMKLGQIYNVTCDSKGNAKTIYEAEDAWERNELTGIKIDEASKKIETGALELSYNTSTIVLNGSEKVSIASVVAQDEVTLRGIDNIIYSVTVDKGHGYLKLTGISTFIDGYISLGTRQLLKVTENMLVTVQEGTHVVELQNGSVRGEKTVNIVKDEESVLDFSEYVKPPTQVGAIRFKITPENAILTIDGNVVDYSGTVSLSYGTHRLVLQANNYDTYTKTFVVKSAYETMVIDMASKDSQTQGTTAAVSDKTDGYVVKVTEPEGAALYVDSVYIGTVPCSFKKKAGNHIVTLTKNGFSTVSYTISIANERDDVTYAFPEMNSTGKKEN